VGTRTPDTRDEERSRSKNANFERHHGKGLSCPRMSRARKRLALHLFSVWHVPRPPIIVLAACPGLVYLCYGTTPCCNLRDHFPLPWHTNRALPKTTLLPNKLYSITTPHIIQARTILLHGRACRLRTNKEAPAPTLMPQPSRPTPDDEHRRVRKKAEEKQFT